LIAATARRDSKAMNKFAKVSVTLAVFVFAAGILTCFAATLEDDYIATRDAAIARFAASDKAGQVDDKTMDAEKAVLAGLEHRLRTIIGPVAIRDAPKSSTINLDTLFDSSEGFGLLDGLVFGADTDKTHIIVTTDNLFKRWLIQHRNWWGLKSADIPQEMGNAVRADAFYTQAISTDAAVSLYGDLRLRKPAGVEFVFATLAARSQDRPPSAANELFVVAGRGGRVFVIYTNDFAAVGPISACDAIRRNYDEKAQAAYRDSSLSREEQSRQSDLLSEKSDTEFIRCFKEHAPQQMEFAGAMKAAQALLERLAPR
jgi:hypothetical protein